MQISILRNILEASDSPMTPAEINAQAACFVCLGMSLAQAQILVLLNAVATATSGGGDGGAQEIYQDRAPAAPDDPTKPALSYPTGGGLMFQWDVASQTWI